MCFTTSVPLLDFSYLMFSFFFSLALISPVSKSSCYDVLASSSIDDDIRFTRSPS